MPTPQDDERRQLWLIPSEGRARTEPVADVALLTPTYDLASYAIPPELAAQVAPGMLVHAPFGRKARPVLGWCVAVSRRPWRQTRPALASLAGSGALLSPGLIALGLWISDYYAAFPGKTLSAMTPAGLRQVAQRRVRYLRRVADPAAADGGEAGAAAEPQHLTPAQSRLLLALADGELPRAEVLRRAQVGEGTLATLRRRGLVETVTRFEAHAVEHGAPARSTEGTAAPGGEEAKPDAGGVGTASPTAPEDGLALTAGQEEALKAVSAALSPPRFEVFVLFGVPGSGKTEVYVRAVRQALAGGRQAIVLVPEIALATQVMQRLARRFGSVAVVHSRLRERERRETWRRIASGEAAVVIGTRAAVFAPCPRLGLIVVDEEQERSYKNMAAPHYHARDVAIKRGQIEQAPVLIGSASPALETWHNAAHLPHYRLLHLPERVPGARAPQARLVLMGQGDRVQPSRLLSLDLVRALQQTLELRQQAVLLHNRRGYAAHLRCGRCGLVPSCVRCGAALVFHRTERLLKCHRCGGRTPAPERCLDDTCGGVLEKGGLAIQRLEEELRAVLPGARLLRLDSDTMRHRDDYAAALTRFERGDADILLGTQMIAKGLDFPNVRLVGVVDADAGLELPDFRAAEHTFQLLLQVVGRAGRREGEALALIQCRDVSHVIRCAMKADYRAFAESELALRARLGYPPLGRLARFVLSDERNTRAREAAERLAEQLQQLAGRVHPEIRVVSVGACLLPRLRGRFRHEVLVAAPPGGVLQRLLHEAQREKLLFSRAQRITVDVDPVEMR
ncbi:MAG: primosomal protein N' [Phycisphaerae bacterium]|nr:primosomal protein N' [Phycisphaerae bacterium]MCZ2400701.1 primosomal protein N' [Phycisphaerae bacterium]